MTTVLHKPQPLLLARLHPGVVLVVLHIGVLWLANLNWLSRTVLSGQIFAKAGHSFSAGNHSRYQIISIAAPLLWPRGDAAAVGKCPTQSQHASGQRYWYHHAGNCKYKGKC